VAIRAHDSRVFDRWGFFALVVLLTGQFLEVLGPLLPWFKELD